jgi:adenine-specific DNA-methyltransferase
MAPEQELNRLSLQAELDAGKTQIERNKMGQFATPTALATQVLQHGKDLLNGQPVRFLDPAFGTGSFYSALRRVATADEIEGAVGFEIDPHYGLPAAELWRESKLRIELADFTKAKPNKNANLLICNPPYVRHHHIDKLEKDRLQTLAKNQSGVKIGGLAGLYCYFLGIAHAWMADGGIAGWLIPSEFMDVNYGRQVKKYLREKVTLLQIHRYDPDDLQFSDALVSSAVVWFRNTPPPEGHTVLFTYGGSLSAPHASLRVALSDLATEDKWSRFPNSGVRAQSTAPAVGDFFKIKRGIATGDNKFFILNEDELNRLGLDRHYFKPILPSPRQLPNDEIDADPYGVPQIEKRLFLLDTVLPEDKLEIEAPALWNYLQSGKVKELNQRYLCSKRKPWYAQENREPAPIVCTYMGRGNLKNERPFRFIRNRSKATVANVYLAMYPTAAFQEALTEHPEMLDEAWRALNRITAEALLGEGRVYGGGLWKIEPSELAKVPLPELATYLQIGQRHEQLELMVA